MADLGRDPDTPGSEAAAAGTLTTLVRRGLWPTVTGMTIAAAVAVAVFGLPSLRAQATAPAAMAMAAPVSVATVESREVNAWSEFSGRLEAVERVDIRSRVAGAIQSVHFREGALVRPGERLVTIDPAPYRAAVERAEAQVAAARARLTYARIEQQRTRRLLDEQAIAQREFDERANNQREAEANLRAAQASLQSARLDLEYTEVRAPVAGRIGKLEITVGNLVAAGPGAPVLTTLVSVDPIYAAFDANEHVVTSALSGLRAGGDGSRADLDRIPVEMATAADGNERHRGRLQLIDNRVDVASGTVRVRAQFENADGALIPGQFARIRMGQPVTERVVLVTERAVGTDQDKKFVLVVDGDNKVAWREVRLGAAIDGLRVVTEGLAAGERVVVNGVQRVRPGSVVSPQPVAMAARTDTPARSPN
jgi:multidrug efflux system membrane fusion protein